MIYFECNQSEAITAFSKLLNVVMNNVYRVEESYLLDVEDFENVTSNMDEIMPKIIVKRVHKSCLIRFFELFCNSLLKYSRHYLSRNLDYFQVIQFIIKMGPKPLRYLIESNLLEEYVDLFLKAQKDMSFVILFTSSKDNDKISTSNLVFIIEIISLMTRGCVTKGIKYIREFAPTSLFVQKDILDEMAVLPKTVEEKFLDYTNYTKYLLPMQQYGENILDITKHLCWGDLGNSKQLIGHMVQCLCNMMSMPNLIDQTFRVLSFIVRLEDNFQESRVQQIFEGHPSKFVSYLRADDLMTSIEKVKEFSDKTYPVSCMKWIADIGSNCPAFANFMKKNSQKFKWMIQYLNYLKNNVNQLFFSTSTNAMLMPTLIASISNKLAEILEFNKEEISPEQAHEVSALNTDSGTSFSDTDKYEDTQFRKNSENLFQMNDTTMDLVVDRVMVGDIETGRVNLKPNSISNAGLDSNHERIKNKAEEEMIEEKNDEVRIPIGSSESKDSGAN